ncbi:MAG: elongation factor P maturation arginine rhamnosyltransferase EarP, partial [Burkholderiales bacterium]|nr:elongation factor P maturation arginine rhamnosyltransferase EarP [Burkholderiales bacterium]
MTGNSNSCDIFCRVVDNFGDIGVCWRLARQLAAEHGISVRLVVDDLLSFGKIAPAVDPDTPVQTVDGVTIAHWLESIDL